MDKTILFSACWISCALVTGNACAQTQQPDIEFLEYLAEMESDRGQLVDPIQIEDLAKNEQIEPNIDSNKVEQGDDE